MSILLFRGTEVQFRAVVNELALQHCYVGIQRFQNSFCDDLGNIVEAEIMIDDKIDMTKDILQKTTKKA